MRRGVSRPVQSSREHGPIPRNPIAEIDPPRLTEPLLHPYREERL
jgi:hypothetical protein